MLAWALTLRGICWHAQGSLLKEHSVALLWEQMLGDLRGFFENVRRCDWQRLTLARGATTKWRSKGIGAWAVRSCLPVHHASLTLELLAHLANYRQADIMSRSCHPYKKIDTLWGVIPLKDVRHFFLINRGAFASYSGARCEEDSWWGVPPKMCTDRFSEQNTLPVSGARLSDCHAIAGLAEAVFRRLPLPPMTRCPVTLSECAMTHSQD